jgi:sialate O-acetylesterase
MNLKPLLYLALVLLLIVQGCKKDAVIIPDPKPGPKPVVTTPPVIVPFSVNNVLQSNMVIQRDKPFTVWGTTTAGYKVTVKVSWNANDFATTSDKYGNWAIAIPAASANSNPQIITCTTDSAAPVVLTNILIGDVWVCAGQSNMVMPVNMISPFNGVTNYKSEIAAADYPLIRASTVSQNLASVPLGAFASPAGWDACSPGTVGKWSGVAYFFAQKLFKSLQVPVGIIISGVNGSYCRDWSEGGEEFNGMISPLNKLSIKGFIWYQGENDSHIIPVSSYTGLNKTLISQWRTVFKQGALPFYFVQMTPFAEDYYQTTPGGGDLLSDYYARFREAQANVREMPNSGMAITMDVGEPDNHHPQNKKPVGERLALLALKNTYGLPVECTGPQYLSWSQTGDNVTLNYVNGTANGLNTIDNKPLNQHFYVAGANHIFRPAVAAIEGENIVLTTGITVQAIRYAFTNAPVTNLQNSAGLPAEPFRTDSWGN